MMRLLITIFVLIQFINNAKAQSDGKIVIIREPKIDSLLKRHKSFLESKKTIKGYRIQLFFDTDRSKANEAKVTFQQKYPNMSAYLLYQQPNFKVRVGDFKSRLEATKYVKEFSTEFGSAFIVRDEIK